MTVFAKSSSGVGYCPHSKMFTSWKWGFLAVLEFSVKGPEVSAGISARHQREAHQVQGLDHDWSLGNKALKMLAWGSSSSERVSENIPVDKSSQNENKL